MQGAFLGRNMGALLIKKALFMKLTEQISKRCQDATLGSHSPLKGPEALAAFAICDALDNARFKFGLEPIHTLESKSNDTFFRRENNGPLPMEYLLRASGEDGANLNLDEGLKFLRERGLSSYFDMAVIPKAIEQAMGYGDAGLPVSVNITPESLQDEFFLAALEGYLESIQTKIKNPKHVVFEIPLTGHTKPQTIAWMKDLQKMGYRIAVDNFGHYAPLEVEAITNLQPAFIKIDGNLIHDALSGEGLAAPTLRKLVAQVRSASPATRIVAPWVTTVAQAKRLYQVYRIDAVQGRDLPKDRTYFSSQWALMAYADSPSQMAMVS